MVKYNKTLSLIIFLSLFSCSQISLHRTPASTASAPSCMRLIKDFSTKSTSALLFINENKFAKTGIEVEGVYDLSKWYSKKELLQFSRAEEHERLEIAENLYYKYSKKAFEEVAQSIQRIVEDNAPNSIKHSTSINSAGADVFYKNGDKFNFWRISKETVGRPKDPRQFIIELSSSILESDEDKRIYLKVFNDLKNRNISAFPEMGAIHFHFDVRDKSIGELKELLQRYVKVHDVLIEYLDQNSMRIEKMGGYFSKQRVIEQIDYIERNIPNTDVLFEELRGHSFSRGALRLNPHYGTVEIRIFDSSLDEQTLVNNNVLSQRLLSALLDKDSLLSKYVDQLKESEITINDILKRLGLE